MRSKRVAIHESMDNVVTILLQQKDHVMLSTRMPGLPKLNWQSNVGHLLDVALQGLGRRHSKNGKELWSVMATEKRSYQKTSAANTRRPKEQRQTVAGQLANVNLSHDAGAPNAGSRAAQPPSEPELASPCLDRPHFLH